MSTIPTLAAFKARIKTRHLLLLRKLGEYGVLRRAAEELNMTQPTATQLLQQLEESLGLKLFVRHSRGMHPTIYGEVLIRYARSIDNDLANARDELIGLSEGSSGRVSIGTVSGAIPGLVGPAIAKFKEKAPMVRVSVQVDSSAALLAALVRDSLDMVIGRIVAGYSIEDFILEPLKHEPMCIVAGSGHPLARRSSVELAELMEETWILQPEGGAIRIPVERALRERDVTDLPNILEATSILLTTSLLQQANMISVIPLDVAQYFDRVGMITILPVDFDVRMERQSIITRRGSEHSPAALDCLEALRAVHAGDMYSDS